MELKQVQSSNIKAIGYEGKKLIIQYNSGATYVYNNVPRALFEALTNAESKGKFVNENIKSFFDFIKQAVKDEEKTENDN